MYDEAPKFSGNLNNILTTNAVSENQAVWVSVARERFRSWEPGLLTRGGNVRLSRTTKTREAVPDELGELRPS